MGDFARVDIDLAGDVDALKQRTKASRSCLHDVDLGDMTAFGPWAAKPRRTEVAPLVDADKEPCDPSAILGTLIVGGTEHAFFIVRIAAPPPAAATAGRAALSITEVVGPTFEHEAREVLRTVFREDCLP